ncbi:hypothetical protein [Pseudomonas sp. NPDC089569]|uniref:hypothetical protein n=1 Tax=Pseudomonas sp. NPDC089569 TaxID=3390722 RepID=UPI003CFDA843
MSWTPVSLFMPVTFKNEYGWPQSIDLMGALRSGRQVPVRFERQGADDDFPHEPGRWISCCSNRWDLTGEVTDWRPLFEQPTGRMPEEPLKGFFVDIQQMNDVALISKALYGDGSVLTADSRRDLAHRLYNLMRVIQQQEVAL